MKKIINRVEDMVVQMCQGMQKAHSDLLQFDPKYKVIKRKEANKDKVCLISGGGSGHEPAHGGFVGRGMLDVAVCGDVFASPSIMQVYNAILQTQTEKGTLLIVKNYLGDCMNFNEAAEMAREDGVIVESVYVNDDIAVEDSLYTVGRRGVAGTIFVHKIVGAAAELGKELCEVKRVAQKTIQNVKSIGIALTSCTVPAKGTPTFQLSEEEIEFGVGIHGEPGIERRKLVSSREFAQNMCTMITNELKLKSGDECAVILNGLGGTPLMELYLFYNDVSEILINKGIKTYKTIVGNYMTSLEMAGLSLSVLKLDDELKTLLDKSAVTVALKI